MTTPETEAQQNPFDQSSLGDATQTDDFQFVTENVFPPTFEHTITGEPIANPDIIIDRRGKVMTPPPLSEDQLDELANQVDVIFDAVYQKYPRLATSLRRNPQALMWMPEIQLGISSPESSVTTDVQTDMVSEIASALLETPSDPDRINSLNKDLASNAVVKTYWDEVASKYDSANRAAIPHVLASVSEEGAEKVLAEMLAWSREHGVDTEQSRGQQLALLYQKVFNRQQSELGRKGFFGLLDKPRAIFENLVTRPAVEVFLSPVRQFINTPEEARLAQSMTTGQSIFYTLGVRPSFEGWGLFEIGSGAIDGYEEFIDPLGIIAGIGAGNKALKTVTVSNKAIKAGKLAAVGRAARAFLSPTRHTAGIARDVRGGRIARAMYAFRPKTVNNLLDGMVKSGVAGDMRNLLKVGRFSEFAEKYPQYADMPNRMRTAISKATDDQMVVEVLKSGAINDLAVNTHKLEDAEAAATEAWTALGRKHGAAPIVDDNDIIKGLEDFANNPTVIRSNIELLTAGDTLRSSKDKKRAEAVINWWKRRSTPTNGLYRGTELDEAPEVGRTIDVAIGNATGRVEEAAEFSQEAGEWLIRFGDETPAALNPRNPNTSLVSGRFEVTAVDTTNRIADVRHVEDILPTPVGKKFGANVLEQIDTIADQPLLLDALQKQAQVDLLKATKKGGDGGNLFAIFDVPRKIPKDSWYSYNKLTKQAVGNGRFGQGIRRFKSKALSTSGVDNEVSLVKELQGVKQLKKIMQHFGVAPEVIENVVADYRVLNAGDRWEFMLDTVMPVIGDETGIPHLQHALLQYYDANGMRRFGVGAFDEAVDTFIDADGVAKSGPIMYRQTAQTFPIPVQQIDAIAKRYRSINNPARAAIATGFRSRGWVSSTKSKRGALVERFAEQLRAKGQDIDLQDAGTREQLYDWAYAYVDPSRHPGSSKWWPDFHDGRGMFAGKVLPTLGSGYDKLHSFFKQSMLVLRPWQWALRVGMEEQLRGFMMGMPSFYRNPFKWGARVKEAWAVSHMNDRVRAASAAAGEAQRIILGNASTAPEGIAALRGAGIFDELFDSVDEASSFTLIESRLRRFLRSVASNDSRLDRMDAAKGAIRDLKKNRAKVERARDVLKKHGFSEDFDFLEDAREMQHTALKTFLGNEIGSSASGRVLQWSEVMAPGDAAEYGQGLGKRLFENLEDRSFRTAMARIIAKEQGLDLVAEGVDGAAIARHTQFKTIQGALRKRFPEVLDEAALAERWMDEVLEVEARRLLDPLLTGKSDTEVIQILNRLLDDGVYETELMGVKHSLNLRDSLPAAMSDMGELVRTQSIKNSNAVRFPRELPTDRFDPRFMDESNNPLGKFKNWILEVFGEDMTQHLNRRPALLEINRRWFKNYTDIGVPESMARRLASRHAIETVNNVYFNAADAPHIVQALDRYIPFFTASYEVASTWAYKMPAAVGGNWLLGVGEFGRKMQRLMDGLVNIGLVTRLEEEDGSIRHVINLGTEDLDDARGNPIGQALGKAGLAGVKGLAFLPAHILNMAFEADVDDLYEDGIALEVGNPLNPFDYGILSYAQAQVGLGPAVNWAINEAAPLMGLSVDAERTTVQRGGETLQQVADRLGADPIELAKKNFGLLVDDSVLGSDRYNALLVGQLVPEEIQLEAGTALVSTEGGLWDSVRDIIMPFGAVDNVSDVPLSMLPGVLRYGVMGLGIASVATDEFYTGDFDKGALGLILPEFAESQVSGMLAEAFMYIESHDIDARGRGPFARIQDKRARIQGLVQELNVEDSPEINRLRGEIREETEALLERAKATAAGTMFQRMWLGTFLPTSPRHLRKEHERINSYWESKEYADQLKGSKYGIENIKPFTPEEMEQFFEQVHAFLAEDTGDRAKATFLRENPTLGAYLVPKTFWETDGRPPEIINNFDDHAQAIAEGKKEGKSLAEMMGDSRSQAILNDFYIKVEAKFGGESPEQTAANILHNYEQYDELREEKNLRFDALYMSDDINGGEYLERVEERRQRRSEEDPAITYYLDVLNEIRDKQGILLDVMDDLDSTFDETEIIELRKNTRRIIGVVGDRIEDLEALGEEREFFQNPTEQALNRYFDEYYNKYSDEIGKLFDELDSVRDSEQRSLVFEKIKLFSNDHVQRDILLGGGTTPYPNALDFKWQRKDELEKEEYVLQRLNNPVLWMDLEGAKRVVENSPIMSAFVPNTKDKQQVYQQWTLRRIEADEAYERGQVSWGDRNKIMDGIEQEVRDFLIRNGRGREVEYMDMTPIERMELANVLPAPLGIYVENVRYLKEQLKAADLSPGSEDGKDYLRPWYQQIKADAFSNPEVGEALDRIGMLTYDDLDYDSLLPMLMFGSNRQQ